MKSVSSSKTLSVVIGLCAVVMLWFSAAVSVPLVKRYHEFRPEMLLIVRGLAVALGLLAVVRKSSFKELDKYVLVGGVLFTVASITFFQAVNLWAANPVIVIITMTPVVNFAITLKQKVRISKMAVLSLKLILVGVVLAVRVPNRSIEPCGLMLAIISTITAGMGMECWSKTKAKLPGKMMLYSICLALFSGLVLLLTPGKIEIIPPTISIATALYVFGIIGCFSGIIYFCSASIALERLPVTTASILLQGETPAVIIGSWLLAGERISLLQSVGVVTMLAGIILLMSWTATRAKKE